LRLRQAREYRVPGRFTRPEGTSFHSRAKGTERERERERERDKERERERERGIERYRDVLCTISIMYY
jgi:hypothetical protein